MTLGKKDRDFEIRAEAANMRSAQKQKTLVEASGSRITDFVLSNENSGDKKMTKNKTSYQDKDYNANISKEKEDYITVNLPRKMVTPNVTAM